MIRKFEYRLHPAKGVFLSILLTAFAIWLAYLARTNEDGLRLLSLIELEASKANIFYGAISAILALLVLSSVVSIIHGQITKPCLILTEDHIDIPDGLIIKNRTQRVMLAHVREASLRTIKGQDILILTTMQGDSPIVRSLLAPEAFNSVIAAIEVRVPLLRE